jgi:hypothetical protein
LPDYGKSTLREWTTHAWLERNLHHRLAIRTDHRPERHPRRCPNLRGPTPTKPFCGRARAKERTTSSTTTLSTAATRHRKSPRSGASLLCPQGRSSTGATPPRSLCASSGVPCWPQRGREIWYSTPSAGSGRRGLRPRSSGASSWAPRLSGSAPSSRGAGSGRRCVGKCYEGSPAPKMYRSRFSGAIRVEAYDEGQRRCRNRR